MTDKYDDIINLEHWDPKTHKRMPLENRAAQFAPFAALTGHDEAIRETARRTDQWQELDAETAAVLNEKMHLLSLCIADKPEIEVTYFVNDLNKSGGSYAVHKGALRRIEEAEMLLVFADGHIIPIPTIREISGDIFADIIREG